MTASPFDVTEVCQPRDVPPVRVHDGDCVIGSAAMRHRPSLFTSAFLLLSSLFLVLEGCATGIDAEVADSGTPAVDGASQPDVSFRMDAFSQPDVSARPDVTFQPDVFSPPDVVSPPDVFSQADVSSADVGTPADAAPDAVEASTVFSPVTIYAVKTGVVAKGAAVEIVDALVTGKGSDGFFVQTKQGDVGYAGSDHSGLFVFAGASSAVLSTTTVGARVTIDGVVDSSAGEVELDSLARVTVTAAGPEAAPVPVAVAYADIATGGTRASTLEGVIVQVGAGQVSSLDVATGAFTLAPGSLPDASVADASATALVVDDYLFKDDAAVGEGFASVTGIVALRQSISNLEPRSASDFVPGAPAMLSVSPAMTFARLGDGVTPASTLPTPLTVTLTNAWTADTVVAVASSDSTSLSVPASVTVPAGAISTTVPVIAKAQAADVKLTFTLGLEALTADVRVLSPTESPTAVTLTPVILTLLPNAAAPLVVSFDIPPTVDTGVALHVVPTNAGTLPGMVTVLANTLSTTFMYTDSGNTTAAAIEATFGMSTATTNVTIAADQLHLVINEVDYDQPGTDSAEYVEIYNPSIEARTLVGVSLILVNGANNMVYDTVDLSSLGSLASHGYVVIAGAHVTVQGSGIHFSPTSPPWTTNAIQNGNPE